MNSHWIRRLAGHLVRDDDAADDLAQEAWLAAVQGRSPADVALPAWLGGILRNLALMRARARSRRSAREQLAAAEASLAAAPVSPADALERAELQQLLGGLVLGLAEPYRSTLVLRYYDGLTASEIARRTEVPAGTVRWRLKHGLDTIRTQLDHRWGQRQAWLPLLAPFVGAPALPGGTALRRAGGGPTTFATVALGLAVLGAGGIWIGRASFGTPWAPAARSDQSLASSGATAAPGAFTPIRSAAAGQIRGPHRRRGPVASRQRGRVAGHARRCAAGAPGSDPAGRRAQRRAGRRQGDHPDAGQLPVSLDGPRLRDPGTAARQAAAVNCACS